MIRACTKKDLDELVHIWLEASVLAHPFISPAFWHSQAVSMREVYIPSATTYVYTDGESKPLAFISMRHNCIEALFVSAASQRRGIGFALIDYAKQLYPRLSLKVYAENESALAFYLKQGFKIEKEVTDAQTGHREFSMTYTSRNQLDKQ